MRVILNFYLLRYDEGNSIANMIVEVPRWTHAKLELSVTEALNPIKHVSALEIKSRPIFVGDQKKKK